MCEGAIAVIGSVNMDIGGYPERPPLAGDSNPGKVRLSLGGVGCNIARNLARLGAPVCFLTALGGDLFAQGIERELRELDIDLSCALRLPREHTSTYLFVADERGDMLCAINDMAIYRHQTVDYFARHLDRLNRCRAVMLDANLTEEALAFLAKNVRAPLFADAVSAAKAPRLRGVLSHLKGFKPNRLEAEALTGRKINDIAGARRAARALLDAGVERVFITLGAQGVFAADEGGEFACAPAPMRLKNATGAGDAFSAVMALGCVEGQSLRRICLEGSAAAAIAAECEQTFNPALSRATLQQRIMEEPT